MWSELLNYILPAIIGGGLVQVITITQQRKKARAEADGAKALAESTELDNVEKAIRIWREMAENLQKELETSRTRYEEMTRQVNDLRKAVEKLNSSNQRILKLLDRISPENMDKLIAEIKHEIKGDA